MEETQLRLEDGVDKDEVFASDADAFDDLHLLFLQQLAVDEFDVQADLAQQVDRLGHQLLKDAVEQDVGVAEIHFLSVLDALLVFLEELRNAPRVLFNGDNVFFAPEDLHFLDFHEFVLAVEVGEV